MKRTGHYACLVALFLEVIVLAIILLAVGLVVPRVLVIASTTIMALIVLMMIVRLAIVRIMLVTLMVVVIFVATMLLGAQFMATSGRNMSRILFLWLLLVLGNLLKNASYLVGRSLTLLKEGNHSERVGSHHLVQVGKLVLVCLRLCKEDLVTLLLHRGYVHHLTEVVALEVAENLYSMTHELVHWHESGLLGRTKPANQLVANVGEPGNGLKVVPDTFVKIFLRMICIFWTLLCNDAGPFGQAYFLKTLTH
jgi:hypothetical protein